MILFDSVVFIIVLFFFCIVLLLAIEVLGAVFQVKKNIVYDAERKCSTVLIPAHDEETVIAATIEEICPQLNEGDQILVVADNCSDNTAEIARRAGANVIERSNTSLLGKGYALDFGIKFLKKNPPDVLIVVDADCKVGANYIDQVSRSVLYTNKPVQTLNLMESPPSPSVGQRIAEFAFLVKNYVRPLGMKWLGLPCHLMGTGMAFPWSIISSANLANGNIVEDMNLGVELICKGCFPVFVPEVVVLSMFPVEEDVTKGQRERWEHGHLETIFSQAPKLLYRGFKSLNYKTILFAVDLAIFPLALLSMLLTVMTILTGAYFIVGNGLVFFLEIMLLALLVYAISIWVAWIKFGRNILSFVQLIKVPIYILSKAALYLKFVTNKQEGWVKTKRDKEL